MLLGVAATPREGGQPTVRGGGLKRRAHTPHGATLDSDSTPLTLLLGSLAVTQNESWKNREVLMNVYVANWVLRRVWLR